MDTEVLLQLPHGAKPVDPRPALLDIYVAMVIGDRSKTRDFSDLVALDRCKKDVSTATSPSCNRNGVVKLLLVRRTEGAHSHTRPPFPKPAENCRKRHRANPSIQTTFVNV